MQKQLRAAALAAAAIGIALASCNQAPSADTCKISVVGVEKFDSSPGKADIAYRVKGEAGSGGVVSLVAKLGPDNFITGKGVNVGPGPFLAVVDLKLTGTPPELLALLEVGSKRCRAKAKLPR